MRTSSRSGSAEDLAKAFRSVKVQPVLKAEVPRLASSVRQLAAANLRFAPGRFSRSKVKLSRKSRDGLELTGLLAVVAEYGMVNRSWSNWHGGRVQRSPVPPPRATLHRPKPEDGWVIGKAWKQMREQATTELADEVWTHYGIQFDGKKIYKVKG